MAPRDKFDKYFIAHGAARHVKFRRLNTSERHAFFLGVLSIAGQAPIRGCLLVGNLPAEAADVAQEADVHVKFAESALEKLRAVGVIYRDEETGCERVHDFDDWNPAPKVDGTNAERQRRYQAKMKAAHAAVTNGSTTTVTNGVSNATEVEVEDNAPLTPQGEDRAKVLTFGRTKVPDEQRILAEAVLADFNEQAGTGYGAYRGDGRASEDLKRILGALRDSDPPLTLAEAHAVTAWRLSRPFWQGKPHTGVVFGPNVYAANRESAKPGADKSASKSSLELAAEIHGGAA